MTDLDEALSADIETTLSKLKELCGETDDLNIMRVRVGRVECAAITAEGQVSNSAAGDLIFQPLMYLNACDAHEVADFLMESSLLSTQRSKVSNYRELVELMFSGFCIVLADGWAKGVAFGAQGFEKRSVSPPDSEQTVYGPQDSFNETVRNNISLIRRRLKTPFLKFEMIKCGRRSRTDVCIIYMRDKASARMVAQIRKRLKDTGLDTVLSGGYIEPFVDGAYNKSFFPGVTYTQRPDAACLHLNEGRVCILVDGSPFCLVCPALFSDSFRTMDDMSAKPGYATFIRWLKYFAFVLAVALPGLYVALVMYHPEAFALKLLLNLYVSEEATPFPLPVEMTVLVLMFEIMREAGIRLPKAVGGAVSIVGGLIIGDAAVKSGLISVPLLIVVGITATSAFVIPRLDRQITLLRIVFIIAASTSGLFGVSLCCILFMSNICAMNDLNVSFLSPLSPINKRRVGEVFFRRSFRGYAARHSTVTDFTHDDRRG
ncbi:spore germination protein [Ruminococcus sp. FC2018]|uniref:spore germination protein n=1 Tax=Ruminococcus sp. FC2018 TaxID=1410617 RepID=UPI00048BAEA3|nr:spore germination protein [Ruminococcus sp. FC2018]